MFENEESSSEDVDSLRDLLRLTEISLQNVGQQLRWANCNDMKPLSEPAVDSYTTSGITELNNDHLAISGLVLQMIQSYSWHTLIFLFLYSQSGHDDEFVQPSLDHLTLQDLQTPDGPLYQPGCVCQERRLSGTVERRAAGSLSPSSTNSRVRKRIFVWVKCMSPGTSRKKRIDD